MITVTREDLFQCSVRRRKLDEKHRVILPAAFNHDRTVYIAGSNLAHCIYSGISSEPKHLVVVNAVPESIEVPVIDEPLSIAPYVGQLFQPATVSADRRISLKPELMEWASIKPRDVVVAAYCTDGLVRVEIYSEEAWQSYAQKMDRILGSG